MVGRHGPSGRGVPGTPGTAGSAPNDGIAAGVEVLFQPWAAELYKARADNKGKGTPSERCLPHGITKAVSVPEPFKIVQTPELIVVLHEEFNHHRQIFMDGRRVPPNRTPTWLGYSTSGTGCGGTQAEQVAGSRVPRLRMASRT